MNEVKWKLTLTTLLFPRSEWVDCKKMERISAAPLCLSHIRTLSHSFLCNRRTIKTISRISTANEHFIICSTPKNFILFYIRNHFDSLLSLPLLSRLTLLVSMFAPLKRTKKIVIGNDDDDKNVYVVDVNVGIINTFNSSLIFNSFSSSPSSPSWLMGRWMWEEFFLFFLPFYANFFKG